MARYTDPFGKYPERLRCSILGNGKNWKRSYAPGQYGQCRRKLSELRNAVVWETEARHLYGMTEKQSKNSSVQSGKMKGKHGENFLLLLESRPTTLSIGWGLRQQDARRGNSSPTGTSWLDGKKSWHPFLHREKPGQTITLENGLENCRHQGSVSSL